MINNKNIFGMIPDDVMNSLIQQMEESHKKTLMEELGNYFAGGAVEFNGQPPSIDIIEEITNFMKNMERPKPFPEFDHEKEYLLLVPDTLPEEFVSPFREFKNITIKPIPNQYLPDKQSVYFMPAPEDGGIKVKFQHLPYTSHLLKEE